MTESQAQPSYFQPCWIQPTREICKADLCVYGASAAGIIAAVKAARLGHSVVLLQPGLQAGGMTTSGLGLTDFGRQHVIGGMTRAFYERLGQHYRQDRARWTFEPKAAMAVFDAMLAEAGVSVRWAQYLDSVEQESGRITVARCLGGLTVQARVFIDATYEGDLMAKAEVAYHVGREANTQYGEQFNGIQPDAPQQQFVPAVVSPFVVADDRSSGLLPHIDPRDLRSCMGQADTRIQAYNFRICMTDDPDLRLDWVKPEGFNPQLYELAIRWFNVADQDPFNDQLPAGREIPHKFDVCARTPKGFSKTDTNNHGPVSSDFIGANADWPEANYATREQLFQSHVNYQKGLYWVLANDPRIPQKYREAYQRWGLAKDEFISTGHWPHQLYVRESRRMIGDYVVTEHDCTGAVRPDDPVGMGSYTMDSHHCCRYVAVIDGQAVVMNEGEVQVPPTDPYPISYRAIVPASGQCSNLIVPVCLSASHIAYGSARMEPVFMVLGESAACAASRSIHDGVAVQHVAYDKLQPMLIASNQVLRLAEAKQSDSIE